MCCDVLRCVAVCSKAQPIAAPVHHQLLTGVSVLTIASCSVLKSVSKCDVRVPAALPTETPAYEQSLLKRALYIRRKEPYVLAENSPVYLLKEPCVFAKRALRIR